MCQLWIQAIAELDPEPEAPVELSYMCRKRIHMEMKRMQSEAGKAAEAAVSRTAAEAPAATGPDLAAAAASACAIGRAMAARCAGPPWRITAAMDVRT